MTFRELVDTGNDEFFSSFQFLSTRGSDDEGHWAGSVTSNVWQNC